ncbi:MAG TPA: cyclopropane-fatty-acyl-phospholipid synthase family protein [Alphaproteobacteria bacterium]|nr:cyclopropane-fatty-acyl-phospholipid synthase family protein [Alphaproteobacteria bacterium]
MLLAGLLKRIVKRGSLVLIDPEGRSHRFGEPGREPDVVIAVRDHGVARRIFVNPYLALGEAYMDGSLTIEKGSLYNFLDLISANLGMTDALPLGRVRRIFGRLFRSLQQFNPMGRAQRNVAHHYDLSDQLYDLFLDRDRQYSCAYFETPHAALEDAQLAKKRHIAAKLLMKPGQKVLDIGSGWGGMGLYLAQTCGADVTGVTLSHEQLAVSQHRAKEAGLDQSVRFRLEDYRNLSGRFDRIVSVGMFEHVGVPHYPQFFAKVRDLLAEDGVMLLHAIGRSDGPGTTNPWIRKYIFPGGYIPALSEVLPSIERMGLMVTDIEILRLHYAETLRHWRQRFLANLDRVKEIYDERFCRMWEFYLAGSEVSFRYGGLMVFQIQLAKSIDAVPLTRDYVGLFEQELRRKREIAA